MLVQPDKNGAYRVIGGAGGALNYLKLRGVRSASEYRQEAAKRASRQREAKRLQVKRWDAKDLAFDADARAHLPADARTKAQARHQAR